MPKYEKDFKRLVRERMARTGESYSAARAQLEARPGLLGGTPSLGELLALAHQLPQWLRRMHVRSTSWVDTGVRGEAVHHPLSPSDDAERIRRREHETWFEIDDAAWARPLGRLGPTRWREETTSLNSGNRRVYGGDVDGSWQDGPNGLVTRPGHMMGQRPDVTFSCDNLWASWSVPLEVGGVVEVSGRTAGLVNAATPVRSSGPSLFAPPLGDRHELSVDLETGLLLRLSSYYREHKLDEHEIVEFSFPDSLDDALFALPTERPAVEVPAPQRLTNLGEVGRAVPFPVYAPAWLPDGYQFGMATVMGGLNGSVSANLSFFEPRSRPGNLDTINVNSYETAGDSPENGRRRARRAEEVWFEHEWNGLNIRVSSDEPAAVRRQARVRFEGRSRVSVWAKLPLDDLLHMVGSLESLPRQVWPRPGSEDRDGR